MYILSLQKLIADVHRLVIQFKVRLRALDVRHYTLTIISTKACYPQLVHALQALCPGSFKHWPSRDTLISLLTMTRIPAKTPQTFRAPMQLQLPQLEHRTPIFQSYLKMPRSEESFKLRIGRKPGLGVNSQEGKLWLGHVSSKQLWSIRYDHFKSTLPHKTSHKQC
jgi:hypothetical protein